MVSTLRMLTSLMFHCPALLRCVVNRIGELGWAIVCSVTWHDDALSVVNSIVTWNRMETHGLPEKCLSVNHCGPLQAWNSPHTRRFWISRASRFFARIPPWKARKTVVLTPAIPPDRRSFRWITFNVLEKHLTEGISNQQNQWKSSSIFIRHQSCDWRRHLPQRGVRYPGCWILYQPVMWSFVPCWMKFSVPRASENG